MASPLIWRNLFHLFFVVPFLGYIGYNQKETPSSVFQLLMAVGLVIMIYHGYRYLSTGWIINAMHVPLGLALILMGYFGASLPTWMFKIFTLLAIAAFIWHSYLLYTRIVTPPIVA